MFTDLRLAFRQLRARPAFTFSAALSLALGIGLVATQFSLIDGVLLRGLPLPDLDQLYHIGYQNPQSSDRNNWEVLAHRDYLALRERQTSFQTLAATQWSGVNLSGPSLMPSRHSGAYTTANLPEVLRVQPMLGRWFTADETRPGQPLAVVLSHALWQDQFGASPGALGRAVSINGIPGTVVGVMPPKFSFPGYEGLWVSLHLIDGDPRERPVDRLEVFGRLRPGITAEQARAELDTLAAGFTRTWPRDQQGLRAHEPAAGGPGLFRRRGATAALSHAGHDGAHPRARLRQCRQHAPRPGLAAHPASSPCAPPSAPPVRASCA